MKIIKFLFAIVVLFNIVYLIYLSDTNSMVWDYPNQVLVPCLENILSIQDADGFGKAFLLLAESGLLVVLWGIFLAITWFWKAATFEGGTNKLKNKIEHSPSRQKMIQLASKPDNMTEKLYQKYQEAAMVNDTSKAGSIMLLRSFLEAIIEECFRLKKSSFFNSIAKLRRDGDITNAEANLLHRLRRMGNMTSHQKDLSSMDIKQEDIETIFQSTAQLMQDWYARKGYGNIQIDLEKKLPPARKLNLTKRKRPAKTAEETKSEPPVVPEESELSG